jgi:hypothetical protein
MPSLPAKMLGTIIPDGGGGVNLLPDQEMENLGWLSDAPDAPRSPTKVTPRPGFGLSSVPANARFFSC